MLHNAIHLLTVVCSLVYSFAHKTYIYINVVRVQRQANYVYCIDIRMYWNSNVSPCVRAVFASTAWWKGKKHGNENNIHSILHPLFSWSQITVRFHHVKFIGVGIIHFDSTKYLCSEQQKVHITCHRSSRWRVQNETYNNNNNNNNLTAFRLFW